MSLTHLSTRSHRHCCSDEGSIVFGGGALATGADISADGTAIIVRTYADLRAWHRDPDVSIAATLTEPYCTLTATAENQGEAVAISPDGQQFLTISEGTYRQFNWYIAAPAD